MSKFKIQEKIKDNQHILYLNGKIDEDSDFSILNLKQQQIIIFNLEGVIGINSCGIREWINLMKTIPSNSKVYFVKCDRAMIDQANMIEGFFPPNSFVKSFFIPYYCEHCDEQSNVLCERKSEADKTPVYTPTSSCKNCQKEAEIDIIETKYFKFLKKN